MPGGGRQHRVPGRLPVVMRMDIDPARRDQQPVRVDHPPRRPGLAADRNDAVAVDRDIAGKARRAGAVDDGPAPDDDVVHRACLRVFVPVFVNDVQDAGRGLGRNARSRMALMPGRREAAATLAAPGASAYLPGAAGEVVPFPGALSLQADTELKA